MHPLTVYWSPDFLKHQVSPGHPESASRLEAVQSYLQETGLWDSLHRVEAAAGPIDALRLVHPQGYVDRVQSGISSGARSIDSPDTEVSAESFNAALKMAGAGLQAVDDVIDGLSQCGFILGRPPGHHALPDRAMGFCLFANVALAARHALQNRQVERIAIIDWDVHHGNGTQAVFYDTDQVLFISLHEYPLYPGSGSRDESGSSAGRGFTFNVPMQAGQGDEHYLAHFETQIAERVYRFKPDLMLISAGFDAHAADPLGHMELSSQGFREMTQRVKKMAQELCGGRIISFLEGGYDLGALSESVAFHMAELAEPPISG